MKLYYGKYKFYRIQAIGISFEKFYNENYLSLNFLKYYITLQF